MCKLSACNIVGIKRVALALCFAHRSFPTHKGGVVRFLLAHLKTNIAPYALTPFSFSLEHNSGVGRVTSATP